MTIHYEIGEAFAVYGHFISGRTVTAALFNGETGASIALDSDVCIEIGTTGIFRFNSSNITTPITTRTAVVWQMTDATTELTDESFVVIGADAFTRVGELWQNAGLDPSNPKTIVENTAGADYDEDVDAIHKDVVRSGDTTTITRT